MCPSLACLDVKMYNFLNSEACICTVADLHAIRNYASDAQGHLKTALIGALLGNLAPYLCLRFILQAWAWGIHGCIYTIKDLHAIRNSVLDAPGHLKTAS